MSKKELKENHIVEIFNKQMFYFQDIFYTLYF